MAITRVAGEATARTVDAASRRRGRRPLHDLPLEQIAARLGISTATVSRALRGSPNISRITREAVVRAVSEVNGAAASGRRAPAARWTIGVLNGRLDSTVVPTACLPVPPSSGAARPRRVDHQADGRLDGRAERHSDHHFGQILMGVEAACLQLGWVPYPWQQTALLAELGSDFLDEIAGAIVVGGIVDDPVLDLLARRKIPVVVAGGHVYHRTVNSVAPDYQHGAYLLTRHLLALGHRRIALLPGPSSSHTSAEKLAGFLLAYAERGAAVPQDLIRAPSDSDRFSLVVARELTAALLDAPDPPTAIIYATDTMARAGLEVCLRRGTVVPDQVSIAAFHDDAAARDATPALTTIRIDRSLTGAVATRRLHELIAGSTVAPVTRQMLPVELVVRGSVAPPRATRTQAFTDASISSRGGPSHG